MALRALTTLETRLRSNCAWKSADAGGEGRVCLCSAAAISHSYRGPSLELMEPPLGRFSPQMGTAGGEPPPRARVTSLSIPSCHLLPIALAAWCCHTNAGLAPSVDRTASVLKEGEVREGVPDASAVRLISAPRKKENKGRLHFSKAGLPHRGHEDMHA
ncbi:hypothetical protein Q5P01_006204 [Channa striata]|uniref:Uncharacterized protein n=1 Tax=Channa striata TaxID=64152 RepID=A0AA88NCK5_CHASR|nr:hypothetical protein Q5P01_006204 [Channa striata]